jgi:voltage-gated potassium channel Kch
MRVSGALIRAAAVLGAATAALVLGYIGFSQYAAHQPAGAFGRGWSDILYADLQLFVIGGPQGGAPFPVTLQIARFLAPATTILAGLETLRLLLSEQLGYWASAHARRHAVVTGDGPAAMELARRLCRQYRRVVLVTASAEAQAPVQPRGLLAISGDPADPATLNAAGLGRADVVYACTDQSTTNAAIALRARELSRAQQRPLTAYAQVRDPEIASALRARRVGAAGDLRFRLDFFSIEQIAARALLDQHRLVSDDGQAADAVIVGLGQLGLAVLREIARRREHDGPRQRVLLVDREAAGDPACLLRRFPEVSRCCAVTGLAELPGSLGGGVPTLIFVCLPDNDEALRAGLAAAHALAGGGGRVVICMSQPSPFGAVLTGESALLDNARGRLAVFDVLEEACVPELIRADLADQLARARHRAYVAACQARGESPDVNPSMRPWEELPEDLRDSNRAHIAHIGAKLDAIGCVIIPKSARSPAFAFTGSELEALAEMEHERWVGERLARGYLPGDDRDGGQHPDLVEWDELSDQTKDKDRDTIRELPGILEQAGFQILRLDPPA